MKWTHNEKSSLGIYIRSKKIKKEIFVVAY